MCLTYYDRTTKTCHILSKNLSIVLKLLSDDRAAPTELSILVAIRLFISFPVSQYKFFLHFNQSHSPFTSASYINIKMKRAKKKLCSKFTDDFTRLFVMPLGTCRAVHFRFDSFFFPHDFNLNCSQSNGIHSYRIFVFSLFPFNM